MTDPLSTHGFFRQLFSSSSDAIYVIDPATSKVLDANIAACKALFMERDEVVNHSVLSLNKDVVGFEQWQLISETIKEQGQFRFVGRHKRKDGSDFPVEVISDFFSHEGKGYIVSIARDISARNAHDTKVSEDNYIRTFVLNEASDGLWDWNARDNSLFLSRQWYRMLGYGPDEVSNPTFNTWKDAIHPEDLEKVIGLLQSHLEGNSSRYEAKYRLRNRQGDYIWVHDRGMVVERDDSNAPLRVVGMMLDVTESQLLAEKLLEHSRYDDLTKLYNRKTGYELFEKHLQISEHQPTEIQIVMFDIDRFKELNDTFGHVTGDHAIQHFTKTMQSVTRKTDILCRWGGEEFLLLCPGSTKTAAVKVVDRILSEFSQTPFTTDEGIELHLSASAGVSSYPKDGHSIRGLVKAADTAMYKAKSLGRNRVCTQEDLS